MSNTNSVQLLVRSQLLSKKNIFTLVIALLSMISGLNAQNTWVQKNDIGADTIKGLEPGARSNAVAFTIGNNGYVGTGSNGSYMRDFWEYNPDLDAWEQKADYGGGERLGAVGYSIGDKGYVGTGSSGFPDFAVKKDFWQYDPILNMWTQKADFGGVPREFAVGFSIGSKGYIGTGYYNDGNDHSLKDFWEYDPNLDTWTQKTDFSGTEREGAVGFAINNEGYIGTGVRIGGPFFKDFWKYDPGTDEWIQEADFGGTSRSNAAAFSIGSRGYVGTGSSDINPYAKKDFWEYDPDLNVWIQKSDFGGSARNGAIGFSIGNKGYLGTSGGISNYWGESSDFWAYDPDADTWTQRKRMDREYAVGFSIGNKGYVGTGQLPNGANIYYTDFWEYNPDSGTWSQKADFAGSPRSGAVGFSIGNKGYLGMGYRGALDSFNTYMQDFWVYNPNSNSWTELADFPGGGRSGAVGFGIGNKGYIGTGSTGLYGFYYKDFWEYDPQLNLWAQKADFAGTERSNAVGFSIGSKGYLGTGYTGIEGRKDFWEYDPGQNSWIQKADCGTTNHLGAVGFSIGNRGYIGTGFYDGSNHRDFWEWDQQNNVWIQKADFGGTERVGAIGFSIGTKGYLGTGTNGVYPVFFQDFWEYTPQQCNGLTLYADADSDGYGDVNASYFELDCTIPDGYTLDNGDCNDSNAAINPSVTEICDNGIDDNCNGQIDDELVYYIDADGDSYGDVFDTGTSLCENPGSGYSINNTDCDDADPDAYPGADEIQNGIDDDCDGVIDEFGVGIPSMNAEAPSLFVFPNPAAGVFTLSFTSSEKDNANIKIEVINSLGQVVHAQNARMVNGKLQQEIQLKDVAEGMYLVKVVIGDHACTTQIDFQK